MESAQDLISKSESYTELKVIETLEDEYRSLSEKEKQIVFLLERCIAEETALQEGVKIAMDKPAANNPPSRKDQEREALKRLEEALMGGSSSDDGDDSST